MEDAPDTVAPTTATDAADPAQQCRPAAAFSVLSNVRGSAVEDTFVLMDDLRLEPFHPACAPVVPLFGVYDGHGGGAAAQHCARRLHRLIADRLEALLQAAPGGPGTPCPLETGAVEGALREAFVAADEELQGSGVLDNNSGSTALVALLTTSSIWLAWAGDSRAVLVRDGKAAEATSDHRPAQREDEKARIERAGGMLLNNGGLRLMGMLATTRAIGDHDLQPYGLTPVPEVMRLPRGPDDEFLVLASDGLWDKVTPQEAAILAHNAWCRIVAARPSWDSAQQGGGVAGGVSSLASPPLTSPPHGKEAATGGDTAPPPAAASPAAMSPSLVTAISDTVALQQQDTGSHDHAVTAAAAAAAAAATAGQANHSGGESAAAQGVASPRCAATCPSPPPPGRTCRACKAARIAAAAMSRCARSRRSRDDTTVVVVNLQQHCQCSRSWATVSAGGAEEEEEAAAFMGLGSRGSLPQEASAAAAAAMRSGSGGILGGGGGGNAGGGGGGGGGAQSLSADVDWRQLARGGSSGKGGLDAAAAASSAPQVPVMASVDDNTPASTSSPPATAAGPGIQPQMQVLPPAGGAVKGASVKGAAGYDSPADSEDFEPMGEARMASQDEVVGGFGAMAAPSVTADSIAGDAGPSSGVVTAAGGPNDPLTALSPFAVDTGAAGGPPRSGSFKAPATAGALGLGLVGAADCWVGGPSPWGVVGTAGSGAMCDDDAGPDSGPEGEGGEAAAGPEGGAAALAALTARLSRGLGARDSTARGGVGARVSARGSGEAQAVAATGASGERGGAW